METLKTYLADKKKADFAERIGTSPSYLSQILSGSKRPSFGMMVRIEQASEGAVSLDAWKQAYTQNGAGK